jgi:hypothetical protein
MPNDQKLQTFLSSLRAKGKPHEKLEEKVKAAFNIADHGLHITGVDSSPEMIALERHRLPEQEWLVADMRRLALNRRFDGILAWDRPWMLFAFLPLKVPAPTAPRCTTCGYFNSFSKSAFFCATWSIVHCLGDLSGRQRISRVPWRKRSPEKWS